MKHSPGFLRAVAAVMPQVREIAVTDLAAMQTAHQTFTLIDVREDNEWQAGAIPGAIHLGKGIIERDIETTVPDKNTPIVLYCGGGFRSALAAKAITDMGYTEVSSLAGGIRAWRAHNAS